MNHAWLMPRGQTRILLNIANMPLAVKDAPARRIFKNVMVPWQAEPVVNRLLLFVREGLELIHRYPFRHLPDPLPLRGRLV